MGSPKKFLRPGVPIDLTKGFCPRCGEPGVFKGTIMGRCTAGHSYRIEEAWFPTHRHKKTGGYYKRLFTAVLEANLSLVVVYEALDKTRWVRPQGEFEDGRFEELKI